MPKRGHFELALQRAMRSLPQRPADAAVRQLALQYARTFDAQRALTDVGGDGPLADLATATMLHQLGANYRMVLVELGLTPKARNEAAKEPEAPKASPLDELRQRRERAS